MREALTTIINHENSGILLFTMICYIIGVVFLMIYFKIDNENHDLRNIGISMLTMLAFIFSVVSLRSMLSQHNSVDKQNKVEVVTYQNYQHKTIKIKEVIVGQHLKVTSEDDQVFLIDTEKPLKSGDKISIQLKTSETWELVD